MVVNLRRLSNYARMNEPQHSGCHTAAICMLFFVCFFYRNAVNTQSARFVPDSSVTFSYTWAQRHRVRRDSTLGQRGGYICLTTERGPWTSCVKRDSTALCVGVLISHTHWVKPALQTKTGSRQNRCKSIYKHWRAVPVQALSKQTTVNSPPPPSSNWN